MGDVFPVFSVNANVPMHIPPHLSPSPLGDLVLAWLKLGRAVSVFFFFSFSCLLFCFFLGCMDGLRAFCGDGLVLLCSDWLVCLGLGAGLVRGAVIGLKLGLSLSLGLALGY